MIQVEYDKTHFRVEVSGHAHSDVQGKDLICAGASTLAVTMATNIRYMREMGYVKDSVTDLNIGHAVLSCVPEEKYTRSVEQVMNSVCVGFEILAEQYPEYISYRVLG